ncbi:MAG TPA: hypothetical protein VFO38_01940 [Candidatus Saccharimonadales bacterium]|nr:hypothetical protein [Candidatus Saccharimonadales bacterium]
MSIKKVTALLALLAGLTACSKVSGMATPASSSAEAPMVTTTTSAPATSSSVPTSTPSSTPSTTASSVNPMYDLADPKIVLPAAIIAEHTRNNSIGLLEPTCTTEAKEYDERSCTHMGHTVTVVVTTYVDPTGVKFNDLILEAKKTGDYIPFVNFMDGAAQAFFSKGQNPESITLFTKNVVVKIELKGFKITMAALQELARNVVARLA